MIARVVHACIATAALTVAGLAGPVADQPALAAFSGTASGPAAGVGQSIPQAAQPTATVARRDVTVSWPPTTLTGGTPATSYSVRRRDADGVVVTALTSCGSGGATSCVDSNVPTGNYRYTVQAMVNRWQGAESPLSELVVVSSQSFQISSNPVIAALPAVVTVVIANFVVGELLTYRLDSPSGAVLLGSPAMAAAGVAEPVAVTLPAGVSDTEHSIFIVGSSGSMASASLRVVMPPTLRSLTMDDSDGNGRVDLVTATFSEPLAAYSAGSRRGPCRTRHPERR